MQRADLLPDRRHDAGWQWPTEQTEIPARKSRYSLPVGVPEPGPLTPHELDGARL